MQHTIPQAASLGTPEWLVHWQDGGLEATLPPLRRLGYTVVLADVFVKNTPSPLSSEIEEARAKPDAGGYLIRRAIARAIAGAILDCPAEALRIEGRQHGAPCFAGPATRGKALFVSFSARGALGAIGIGFMPMGVDYEASLPPAGLPWNILREDERAALARLPETERDAAFLALWRAKEAALKAIGQGFRLPPEAVEIKENGAFVAGFNKKITYFNAESAKTTLALA
jgi:phosphopantetheinyl transferase